jgi:hypothetical protein
MHKMTTLLAVGAEAMIKLKLFKQLFQVSD